MAQRSKKTKPTPKAPQNAENNGGGLNIGPEDIAQLPFLRQQVEEQTNQLRECYTTIGDIEVSRRQQITELQRAQGIINVLVAELEKHGVDVDALVSGTPTPEPEPAES